jgi:osmotically-inducible protein OsmY
MAFASTLASLAMLSITGCNNAQEAAGTAGSSNLGVEISDIDVTAKVKTALRQDAAVKNFDIAVYTAKGVVRLTGILDNQNQIDQAFTVTRAVSGVHSIRDELTLKK